MWFVLKSVGCIFSYIYCRLPAQTSMCICMYVLAYSYVCLCTNMCVVYTQPYTNIYCNLTDCARRELKLVRGNFSLTATMFLKILSRTYKHINVRLECVYMILYICTYVCFYSRCICVFTNIQLLLLGKQKKTKHQSFYSNSKHRVQ